MLVLSSFHASCRLTVTIASVECLKSFLSFPLSVLNETARKSDISARVSVKTNPEATILFTRAGK